MKKLNVRRLAALILFGLQISGPVRAQMLDQTVLEIEGYKEMMLTEPAPKTLQQQDEDLSLVAPTNDKLKALLSPPEGLQVGVSLMTSTKAPRSNPSDNKTHSQTRAAR